MSALDDIITRYQDAGGISITLPADARAELAQLRNQADAISHWAVLWSHICNRLNADDYIPSESNFDTMMTEYLAQLRAAAAPVEIKINGVSKVVDKQAAIDLLSAQVAADTQRIAALEAERDDEFNWVEALLAAHPAPAQQEQTE